MIPAPFEYAKAKNLREALNALASSNGSKLLAGGHSLLPLMRFRLAQPSRLVDIGDLPELKGISEKGRGLRIGALTTYRELLDSPLVRARAPLIAEAAHTIGDIQVRNRGTIGGGLAHADPAADLPAVMLALDATIVARSKAGKRAIPAREFFLGPFTTALAPDELLLEVLVPPLPRGARTAYVSHEQAASGYALVGVAVVIVLSKKVVTQCHVAITGVSDRAFMAESAARLVDTRAEAEAIEAVAKGALDGAEVSSDLHAPADYRAHLTRVAVRRALTTALGRSV